jgi:(p)ppGpp synthase/HD superfamily hydrolase
MSSTNNIFKALQFAIKAHDGQLDKVGVPYILHPISVMVLLENKTNHPPVDLDSSWMEKARIVALWHDIAEDTEYKVDDILQEVDLNLSQKDINDISTALQLMTHNKSESHDIYVDRIIQLADTCQGLPLYVKKADIEHNTLPERMDLLDEEKRNKLREKYKYAASAIDEAIRNFEKRYYN